MSKSIVTTTRKARLTLWACLFLSFIILSLSLVNFGIASLFISPITTFMSIVHISTHLIIISIHESRASKSHTVHVHIEGSSNTSAKPPPTSTIPSIIFTGLLVMFYTAAFIVCVLTLSHLPGDSEIFKFSGLMAIFEAIFEALYICVLVWLVVLGLKERKEWDARIMQMVVVHHADSGLRFQELPPSYTRY